MIKFKYLLILTSFFFNHSLFSQKIISLHGWVTDSLNIPIESATIAAYNAKSENFLSYSITNESGYFSMEIKPIFPLKLTASCLGYKKSFQLINSANDYKNGLKFILQVQTDTIATVILNVIPSPVKINGDTTSFIAKYFRDSTEKSLEELLAKFPGYNINKASGEIKYNGKAIQKILIEGSDLADSRYKILSKYLPADFVKVVQVINHFNENELEKGLNMNQDIALNIKISNDKKGKLFGQSQFQINTLSKEKEELKFFNFLPKLKFIISTHHNTIGSSGSDIGFSDINTKSTSFFQQFGIGNYENPNWFHTNPYQLLPFDGEDFVSNNLWEQTVLFNYKSSSGTQWRGNLYVAQDKIKNESSATTVFAPYLGMQNLIEYRWNSFIIKKLNAGLSVVQPVSKNTQLNFSGTVNTSLLTNKNVVQSLPDYITKNVRYLPNNFNLQLLLTHRVKENSVFEYAFSSDYNKQNAKPIFFDTSSRYFPTLNFLYNLSADTQYFRIFSIRQNTSWLIKNKSHLWKLVLFQNTINQHFSNHIWLTNYKNNFDTSGYSNTINYNLIEQGTSLQYNLQRNKSNLYFILSFSGIHYKIGHFAFLHSKWQFIPTPSASVALKGIKKQFTISITRNIEAPILQSLIPYPIQTDYRSIMIGNNTLLSNTGFSGFIQFSSITKSGFPGLYVNLFLNSGKPGYQQVLQPNEYFLITQLIENRKKQTSFNLEVGYSPYLHFLRMGLKIKTIISNQNLKQLAFNGTYEPYTFYSFTNQIATHSVFNGIFNYNAGIILSLQKYSYNHNAGENFITEKNYNGFLDLIFKPSKSIILKNSLDWYFFSKAGFFNKNYLFEKIAAEWNISKSKWTVFCYLRNLNNYKDFLQTQLNANYNVYYYNSLIGANIAAGFNFKF